MATNGEAAARPPPPSLPVPSRAGDFLGKHRLSASISRLNQVIEYLEGVCDLYGSILHMSIDNTFSLMICRVISSTEGKSDALLPITPGPENPAGHRWFQRVRGSQSRIWWMHKGSSDIS